MTVEHKENPMADDLRADLEAALGDTDDGVTQDTTVDAPLEAQPAPESTSTPDTSDGKIRDSLGRFVPKAGDTPAAAANPGGTPAQAQPVADAVAAAPEIAAAPVAQAPTSWGPAVREHWATLPPAVQEQVAQREHQFQQAFREAAPLRNAGEAFIQAIQPYQMAIQAEGVDPITAVTNLMQVSATLRYGTPVERATTIARMVKAYGVDIGALDSALVGEVPQGQAAQQVDPQYVQGLVQQQLAPLFQMAQQRQQAMQEQVAQTTSTELGAFAAANPHYQQVRGLMADVIEVAERNGIEMTLADAYKRACALHPEVSRAMLAQQQGATAQQLTAQAKTAKAAAVSVKGGAPVGNPGKAEPSSIREAIEAAIEANVG